MGVGGGGGGGVEMDQVHHFGVDCEGVGLSAQTPRPTSVEAVRGVGEVYMKWGGAESRSAG